MNADVWVILVQWLHILGGIVWAGGFAFMALAVWPALFRRPGPEARALFTALAPSASRSMGIAAQAVLWLGILRGTLLGPIKSFDALFGTPYGHTFMGAIVLAIAAAVLGAVTGRKLEARVWDDAGQFRPDARAHVRRAAAAPLVLLTAVVACMVLMHFGL
jgi:uncharacterized membrane protein